MLLCCCHCVSSDLLRVCDLNLFPYLSQRKLSAIRASWPAITFRNRSWSWQCCGFKSLIYFTHATSPNSQKAIDPPKKIDIWIFSDCSNLLNHPTWGLFSMVFPSTSANPIPDLWSDVIKPFQVVGGFDDASGLPGESIRSVFPNQQVESDDHR